MKAENVANWLENAARDGRPYHSPEEAAAAIRALLAERDDLQRTFDMTWAAQQRAIEAWQAQHDEPLTWPDHAKLVTWLLEERDALREALVDTTANLVAAISLAKKGGIKGAPSDAMGRMMLEDYKRAVERARTALDSKP